MFPKVSVEMLFGKNPVELTSVLCGASLSGETSEIHIIIV